MNIDSLNKNKKKNIFVGAAWPYANGSLHLGHLAGILGSDFIARYFRISGNKVLFVSGSDCHGTPISVAANEQGISPSEIARKYHDEFTWVFKALQISYDLYSKTTSSKHEEVVQDVFLALYEKRYIYKKLQKLPYCVECNRFLPDRYIEGECPKCSSLARGDQCDQCGSILDAKDLKNPHCKVCKNTPNWRDSEHFFLKLSDFQEELEKWSKKATGWRKNALNFTSAFFKNEKLKDRSITRDIGWGVKIPIKGYEDKRIYVWFEAVCGYLSASKEWAENLSNSNEEWKDYWQNQETLHYYVHGKDNIPFHTIIWPAILLGYGGLNLPNRIISSEYLNLEGKQFSKSKNWAIWLPDLLKEFDPETIRFYIGINGPENADGDFSWNEYAAKTNSELIGKFGNLVNRTLSIIKKNFPNGVAEPNSEDEIFKLAGGTFLKVGSAIEAGKFREALKTTLELVDEANRYLNQVEPWNTLKTNKQRADKDLAVVAHTIKCLAVLVAPFLPKSAETIAKYTNVDLAKNGWTCPPRTKLLVSKDIKPLYKKIEDTVIEKQISCLKKPSL